MNRQDQLDILFNNIEEVRGFHVVVMDTLQQIYAKWNPLTSEQWVLGKKLGLHSCNLAGSLAKLYPLRYGKYLANYNDSLGIIEELKKKAEFNVDPALTFRRRWRNV